jgi:hypothetical protein
MNRSIDDHHQTTICYPPALPTAVVEEAQR